MLQLFQQKYICAHNTSIRYNSGTRYPSTQTVHPWFPSLNTYTHLVFLSWSLIFFSISASVSTCTVGPHCSASASCLTGNFIAGSGASLCEEEEEYFPQSGRGEWVKARVYNREQRQISSYRLHFPIAIRYNQWNTDRFLVPSVRGLYWTMQILALMEGCLPPLIDSTTGHYNSTATHSTSLWSAFLH